MALVSFPAHLLVWASASEEIHGSIHVIVGIISLSISVCGMILALVVFRSKREKSYRLSSISVIALNSVFSLLYLISIPPAFSLQKLQTKVYRDRAASRTNESYLALVEFTSNKELLRARYVEASKELEPFTRLPVSSLRSKELLEQRRTNFANFISTGTKYSEFFETGPSRYYERLENSRNSATFKSNAIRNFKRSQLKQWDELRSVMEKTLLMTSNTLVLDELLLSNYNAWHISNNFIGFDDNSFRSEYLRVAERVVASKNELDIATTNLNTPGVSQRAQTNRTGILKQ
jgi:hypothetical protein